MDKIIVGKTRICTNILLQSQRLNPNRTALVIVPTRYLYDQWVKIIDELKIINTEVEVINTAVTKQYTVDLLALDVCRV